MREGERENVIEKEIDRWRERKKDRVDQMERGREG